MERYGSATTTTVTASQLPVVSSSPRHHQLPLAKKDLDLIERTQQQHLQHVREELGNRQTPSVFKSSSAAIHPAPRIQNHDEAVPTQRRSIVAVHPSPRNFNSLEDDLERMGHLEEPRASSTVQTIIHETSWATWMSLGLCSVLAISSLFDTHIQDVLALACIAVIVFMFPYELNSIQVAIVAFVGLVLSTMNIKQMFFVGLLGAAAHIAVAREGLLYFVPRRITLRLINASVLELLEQPFHHEHQPDEAEQPSSSLNPITAYKTLSRALAKKGLLFASLPDSIRWALLPGDLRGSYEERRRRLIEGPEDHKNGSVLKTLIHLENKVTDIVTTNVNHVEHILTHNPAVRTFENVKRWGKTSIREAFAPKTKESRVGTLLVLSTVVYIAVGWMRTRGPPTSPYMVSAERAGFER